MCQDLTSWVSTLSNHILQHVDLQNTTDGLPLSRPTHMECNKHDNAAHSNMATHIHVHTRTQTRIHTGIYCWIQSSTHTQKRSHKQHVARCRRAHTHWPTLRVNIGLKKICFSSHPCEFLREIPVGALEEMTICATSPNACQSTW